MVVAMSMHVVHWAVEIVVTVTGGGVGGTKVVVTVTVGLEGVNVGTKIVAVVVPGGSIVVEMTMVAGVEHGVP